jgi:Fe-S cluster assembly iron-binding protein IscA
MITLAPEAVEPIRVFLVEQGVQKPIRIHLQSTGCCDASLGLIVDNIRKDDLTEEIDGLKFVISPEIHQLAGDITITYVDEKSRQGFILKSSKSISEWDGFGICTIKV